MKKNKSGIFTISMLIMISLLSGCGNGSTPGSESADSPNDRKEPAVEQEAAKTESKAEDSGQQEEQNAGGASANGSVMTKTAEGAAITCWGWDLPEFNAKVEDYIKESAGITVNGQTMAQEDEKSKISVAASTGTGLPDCFKLNNTDIPRLVEQGAIMDITELAAPYKDKLPQVAWDMVTYEGKIWGMPANSPAGGMFYRYDVLETYGINPEDLTTWEKWIEAGRKITEESGGKVAWIAAPKDKLPLIISWPIFQQYRAEILSSDGKVTINSEAYRNGLLLLQEIKDADLAVQMDEWTAPWYQSMKDGTIACYPSGTWFVQTLIQQAEDTKGKWYFAPFPAVEEGGDRYPNFGSATCFVSSQTKNPEAAFEWCKAWSIDPQGSVEIGLKELGISVVSNYALTDEYVNQPHEYFAESQAYWKVATEAFTNSTYFSPFLPESAEADAIWGRYFEQFWLGKMNADQALEGAEKEIKTKLNLE